MADSAEQAQWLIDNAARWLSEIGDSERTDRQLARLRRWLTAEQASQVLQQLALRRRAMAKFPAAGRMFFTDVALQQATEAAIASIKAKRFPRGQAIADLCCGIGGDAQPLALQGPVHLVDRDPRALAFAAANCRAVGGRVDRQRLGRVGEQDVAEVAAWHIDPDRRPGGRRTTDVGWMEPDEEIIERLLTCNPHGAVKLAPATEVPATWPQRGELQWIGSRRECRQQVAWFGDLTTHAGQRSVTVWHGGQERTLRGAVARSADPGPLGHYLYEPHAAVLAAGLEGVLADQHRVTRAAIDVAYLTGDRPIDDPALATFEILESMALDRKRLRRLLAAQSIGTLEIKKRRVHLDPERLRRELKLRGDQARTLIVFPHQGRARAFLCRRWAGER